MTWGSSAVLRTAWAGPRHLSPHDTNGMQPRSSLDIMPPMTNHRFHSGTTKNQQNFFSPLVLHRGFLSIVTFSAKSRPFQLFPTPSRHDQALLSSTSDPVLPLRHPMRLVRQPDQMPHPRPRTDRSLEAFMTTSRPCQPINQSFFRYPQRSLRNLNSNAPLEYYSQVRAHALTAGGFLEAPWEETKEDPTSIRALLLGVPAGQSTTLPSWSC